MKKCNFELYTFFTPVCLHGLRGLARQVGGRRGVIGKPCASHMAGEDGTTEADDVWAPAHQHDCSAAEVRGYIHSAGPGDDGKGEGAFLPGWRAARQGACAAPRRAGTRRERTQAAGVSVAVATRPGLRRRGTPCRKRRVFFLISGGKLPPSILPIAFAALLSAWAVQPAGNGSVLDAVGQQHQQCPAACPHGACNATLSGSQPGRLAKGAAGEWAESWETWEREHGAESFVVQHGSPAHQSLLDNGGAAHESLLLNPHFVALLVRSAFILLEFGSRPLKNAKKMLSCSLICYWLYQYRYSGSGDSVLGYRSGSWRESEGGREGGRETGGGRWACNMIGRCM